MSEYILVLLWLGIAAVISSVIGQQSVVNICGKYEKRYSLIWAVVVMLPIIWWAGNRDAVADTGVYIRQFNSMPNTVQELSIYVETVTKDKWFFYLSALIHVFVTNDTVIHFLILAVIQGGILVWVYRKYSTDYVLSIFLFIVSTDYISWMYNGIRQFTAVVITFLGIGLILKKKYVLSVLLILLASQFHQSALLMIPFIFLSQGKAWNKKTVLFLVIIIVAVAGAGNFTGLLDQMLADTQYQNVVTDWTTSNDDGTNILRVLVYSVPAILSFWGRRIIQEEDNPVINLCTNMSITAAGFYVLSAFTSGIFMGRLPIYFSLYNYILLPWEVEHLFREDESKFIKGCMIVAYLLFYYYSMHITWNFF